MTKSRRAVIVAVCFGLDIGMAHAQGEAPLFEWEFNSPVDRPICQIDGTVHEGRITLRAPGSNRKTVDLILSKQSWRIPPATRVTATISFSEGTTVQLVGVGSDTEAVFGLDTTTLRPWVHGFTAGRTATIIFGSSNEPPWHLQLAGTSAAISKMYECAQANEMLGLPAPLGTPTTQPFDPTPLVILPHIQAPALDHQAENAVAQVLPLRQLPLQQWMHNCIVSLTETKEAHQAAELMNKPMPTYAEAQDYCERNHVTH